MYKNIVNPLNFNPSPPLVHYPLLLAKILNPSNSASFGKIHPPSFMKGGVFPLCYGKILFI